MIIFWWLLHARGRVTFRLFKWRRWRFYYLGDDDLEDVEGQQNVQATATLYEMEFEDDDLDPSSAILTRIVLILYVILGMIFIMMNLIICYSFKFWFFRIFDGPSLLLCFFEFFLCFSFLINRPKLFLVSLDYKHSTLVKFFIYIRFFYV